MQCFVLPASAGTTDGWQFKQALGLKTCAVAPLQVRPISDITDQSARADRPFAPISATWHEGKNFLGVRRHVPVLF